MRFTAPIVAALALSASASPVSPVSGSDALEKRVSTNRVRTWEEAILLTEVAPHNLQTGGNAVSYFDP